MAGITFALVEGLVLVVNVCEGVGGLKDIVYDVLAPAGEGVGEDRIGREISRGPVVAHHERNIALVWERLTVRFSGLVDNII